MAGQPLHYFQMWMLVQQNYNGSLCNDAAFMNVVSQELLMAIFWEETQFANLRQQEFDHQDWLKRWSVPPPKTAEEKKKMLPGNHAIAFGQVERETLGRIKALGADKLDGLIPGKLGKDIDLRTVDLAILDDDGKGVQLSWRYLRYLYGAGIKSKPNLVQAYGGNPSLANIPPEWLNCEAIQKGYQQLGQINYVSKDMRENMRLLAGAFWIARHNGDFIRAFGVTQEDAAKIGKSLRDIVTNGNKGTNSNPNLVADLRKFVINFVGAPA
jgi:hypothetical protein